MKCDKTFKLWVRDASARPPCGGVSVLRAVQSTRGEGDVMKRAGWSLFVALLVPFGLAAQSVTLARRGQPAAVTLVRPAQASPSQTSPPA